MTLMLNHLKNLEKKVFDDKEKCKEAAKRFNGRLTPGEKQYYGIKYVPAEVINGKFTGK